MLNRENIVNIITVAFLFSLNSWRVLKLCVITNGVYEMPIFVAALTCCTKDHTLCGTSGLRVWFRKKLCCLGI